MSLGKVIRFDDTRGYGFIAPATGGEDVFVHASDFGEQRHLARTGIAVEYEVQEGDRGPKVSTVRIVDAPAPVLFTGRQVAGHEARPVTARVADDDGTCDVLAPHELATELTEVLVRHVPSLTGSQITAIRQRLVEHARSHGWVDS